MEKRRSARKTVSLDATLNSDTYIFPGYVENICDNGMHLIVASKKSIPSFVPETTFDLNCESSDGIQSKLHCEVRWVHINKTPIHGLTYRMGMEIMNHSSEYNQLFNSL